MEISSSRSTLRLVVEACLRQNDYRDAPPILRASQMTVGPSNQCGSFREIPVTELDWLDHAADLDSEEANDQAREISVTIFNLLPQAFLATIARYSGLEILDFRNRMATDLRELSASYRESYVLWFKNMGMGQETACWPSDPGFKVKHFTDIYGYLSAVFIKPGSVDDAIPKRFTDMPPGRVNRSAHHLIDKRQYHTQALLVSLKRQFIGRCISSTYLQDYVTDWAGSIGRVIYEATPWQRTYECPRWMTCQEGNVTSCNLPTVPESACEIINAVVLTAMASQPLIVSWDLATGPRPAGLWLMIDSIPVESREGYDPRKPILTPHNWAGR
ncbi:hypothetical protein CDD82_439 [Ophiocordyceps australis]|uniref:Uncharacterized protein n=1 Tax=Ophiocordyceps australis TaxID=1399860 RepID=A0A2C5ZUG0_9HYPO|nr:hypothetical protein CDD82_439 [Ophiocordyceps australis]